MFIPPVPNNIGGASAGYSEDHRVRNASRMTLLTLAKGPEGRILIEEDPTIEAPFPTIATPAPESSGADLALVFPPQDDPG